MKKPAQVVMLPTNEASKIGNFIITTYYFHNQIKLQCGIKIQEPVNIKETEQHLYLTNNEEIKEGDWVYDAYINKIIQLTNELFKIKHTKQYKKIIATTDKSLTAWEYFEEKRIPQIPDSFIKLFVEAQGNIKEVLVEYEIVNIGGIGKHGLQLKLREDNTVIISPVSVAENPVDLSWMWHCSENPKNILDYSKLVSAELAQALTTAAATGFRLALRRMEDLGVIEMGDIDRSPSPADQEKWDEQKFNK